MRWGSVACQKCSGHGSQPGATWLIYACCCARGAQLPKANPEEIRLTRTTLALEKKGGGSQGIPVSSSLSVL